MPVAQAPGMDGTAEVVRRELKRKAPQEAWMISGAVRLSLIFMPSTRHRKRQPLRPLLDRNSRQRKAKAIQSVEGSATIPAEHVLFL
jgi:hypothetical protein